MPLSDMFKSKEELEKEQQRQQKRELRGATRTIERLQADLDRQAKELEIQIKDAAAKNDKNLAKTLALQLVRVRTEKTRAMGAKSKVSSISNHATSMQTNNKLAQVMANSASVMSNVNQQIDPAKLAQQMGQFQAETTKMQMGESAMDDMFEDLFEEDDEEADAIMNQVLSEISIETGSVLAKLPTTAKDPLASGSEQTASKEAGKTAVKKT